MKNLTALTHGLIGQYGNRKQAGRLSIFVDLNNQPPVIYPVPREIEHVAFAQELYFPEQRAELACLVPVHIDLQPDGNGIERVVNITTGECGMEAILNIKHTRESLMQAHLEAHHLIRQGDIGWLNGREVRGVIADRYAL